MIFTYKRIWTQCLRTHLKLALYKCNIVIIITIIIIVYIIIVYIIIIIIIMISIFTIIVIINDAIMQASHNRKTFAIFITQWQCNKKSLD